MNGSVEQWALVVGFFLPIVIAVVQQPKWSPALSAVVAFLACGVAAAGTIYFGGAQWDRDHIVNTFLVILVSTIATYHGFWRPTNIAPKIETVTSPGVVAAD